MDQKDIFEKAHRIEIGGPLEKDEAYRKAGAHSSGLKMGIANKEIKVE